MLQAKAPAVHSQVVLPTIEDPRCLQIENKTIETNKDKENTTENPLQSQIHQDRDRDKATEIKEILITITNILHRLTTKNILLLITVIEMVEMIENDREKGKDKEELRKIKNILFKHHQATIEQIVLEIIL